MTMLPKAPWMGSVTFGVIFQCRVLSGWLRWFLTSGPEVKGNQWNQWTHCVSIQLIMLSIFVFWLPDFRGGQQEAFDDL